MLKKNLRYKATNNTAEIGAGQLRQEIMRMVQTRALIKAVLKL